MAHLGCFFNSLSQLIYPIKHCSGVVMGAMASQITSLTIVYSTVYSGADQRKDQSFASLAFVWGIHRWPVNSPHKWPVTQKMLPFDDIIMMWVVQFHVIIRHDIGIILCMHPANERPRYLVTPSLIGWSHTQNYAYDTVFFMVSWNSMCLSSNKSWFNIKMWSYQYRKSICVEMVQRLSYLHNGIFYTDKMKS